MAYSVRAGSDRYDNLTAEQALTTARQLLDRGCEVFLYDVEGNRMNLRELVLATAIEARPPGQSPDR